MPTTNRATARPRVELKERSDKIELSVRVPDGVDADTFATECRDGVLTVIFHRIGR